MRGFALLVVFAVACSASTGPSEPSEAAVTDAGGGSAGGPTDGRAGAAVVGAGPSAGAGNAEAAGAPSHDAAEAGAAGADQGGAGAPAHAGEGGGASSGGSSTAGGGQSGGGAGQGGASNQCTGFTAYTIDVDTCLAVTGDYDLQSDTSCSPAGIVHRDHCSTCASWTTITKPLVVMLAVAPGATVKRYDAPGGVCPSNCKYICN